MALALDVDSSEEDEETVLWRADLRRQVEEDLERQVRLRLGFGLKKTTTFEVSRDQESLCYYQRYHQLHKQHTSYHNSHHHQMSLQYRDNDVSEMKDDNNIIVSSVAKRKEDKGGDDGVTKHDDVKRQRVSKKNSHHLGDKAQLLLYLNMYHGPPMKQLEELTISGSYKTHEMNDIRWPVEANITLPTPHHITSVNISPHHITTSQLTPSQSVEWSLKDREDRVVYRCGNTPTLLDHDGLIFESQFESGNLYQAIQTGLHDYTLILKPDLYSKRHVQWFYFRVTNMKTTPTYTFHIVNFEKTDSLYNHGMQPLLYSESEANSSGMGWRHVGWNVVYHHSTVCYPPHMSPDHSYYTLSWSMTFCYHDDTCYLAHCYPYPLTTLYRLLGNIEQDERRAKYVQREELCRTLAGNDCPLLTITEFNDDDMMKKKRGIVITARVHPGETNSSLMMEGLIYFLTSDTAHAHALRQCFVFKLVPMLNPDGVVVGNYRTSLAGVDLNRVYKTPHQDVFPTIHYTKIMMERFRQEREVCVYVDLHGHSRKHNVFMYGCHSPKADHTHFLYERMLPFLLSEQSPDKFSFASCKFAVQRCKETTGRVVTWRSGVTHSFTLEATFCGSNLGPSRYQFTENDLSDLGRDLGEALYKFSKCLRSKTYQLKVIARLAEKLMKKLATPTDHTHSILPDVVTTHQHKKHAQQSLKRFMKVEMCQLQQESSTSGSDSENEDFKFREKKRKHRNSQRRKSTIISTNTNSKSTITQSYYDNHHYSNHPHSTIYSNSTPHTTSTDYSMTNTTTKPQLTLPSLFKQATPTNQRLRTSAPARLQSSTTLVTMGTESKWKFVDRYRNRSNGGIPMFAEERLKERTEKRMKSLSEVVQLPPAPSLPDMVTSKTSHTHSITQPLWTTPHTMTTHNTSLRQQHYQQIKRLVEHGQHTSHHHYHGNDRRKLPVPPSLPSLPPHLLSYINEVWNK